MIRKKVGPALSRIMIWIQYQGMPGQAIWLTSSSIFEINTLGSSTQCRQRDAVSAQLGLGERGTVSSQPRLNCHEPAWVSLNPADYHSTADSRYEREQTCSQGELHPARSPALKARYGVWFSMRTASTVSSVFAYIQQSQRGANAAENAARPAVTV